MAPSNGAEQPVFEGEVISIVVVVANFLSILLKAEEAHDLDEESKLQKYKFLSNYFQHMTPELSKQLKSLLACVQELNNYVVDVLSLHSVSSWPVTADICQQAEEGVARLKRCQQTWQFLIKQLTSLGTKYFPDDRRSKIEARTALVNVSDRLTKLLKTRMGRGMLMCRMILAQGDRNLKELAGCCVALENLKAHCAVEDVYDAQLARCRELMHGLEFFDQLQYELAMSTSTLDDEASIGNQMVWAETKLRQSGVLRVLADPAVGETALMELFLQPAQRDLDRIEIKHRSLEILDSALASGDMMKLSDVIALAEAMEFGKPSSGARAKEEWQRLTKCRELFTKLIAIEQIVGEMAEAQKKGTSHARGEAIRHVNLFLTTHSLATGDAWGDKLLPHRNDQHWQPHHTEAYNELCAAQQRCQSKTVTRQSGTSSLEKVPSFTTTTNSRIKCASSTGVCSLDKTISFNSSTWPKPLEQSKTIPSTPEKADVQMIKLKVHFDNDIRVMLASTQWSFNELQRRLQEFLFSKPCQGRQGVSRIPLRIRYADEAGDLITVESDEELQECWDTANSQGPHIAPKLELHVERRSVTAVQRSTSAVSRRRTASPSAVAVVCAAVASQQRARRLSRSSEDLNESFGSTKSSPLAAATADSPSTPQCLQDTTVFDPVPTITPLTNSEPLVNPIHHRPPQMLTYTDEDVLTSHQLPIAPSAGRSVTIVRSHPYTTTTSIVLDASPMVPPQQITQSTPKDIKWLSNERGPPSNTGMPASTPWVDRYYDFGVERVPYSVPCWQSPHGCF